MSPGKPTRKSKPRPPAPRPAPAKPGRANGDRARSGDPAAEEVGGRDGPDPTRYGDWEVKGVCVDF